MKEAPNPIAAANIPPLPAAPIKPSLALACLKSVPLDREVALRQVQTLKPYWEFQSTLGYNKKPPKGYLSEAVDALGGLDDIAAKLKDSGSYENLYEFLVDLEILRGRVRDVHFFFLPLLLNLFAFVPGVEFLSISKDGRSVSEVFLREDIKHDQNGYTPSPVSTIDGTPALEFLQNIARYSFSHHDPDTRFNSLFPSVAKTANAFRIPVSPWFDNLALNDTTTVTCQNGTTFTFQNTAFVRANFANITSASALYRDFGLTNGTGPLPHTWYSHIDFYTNRRQRANFSSDAFPSPSHTTTGGDFAGFLPPSLNDTAILSVSSFNGPSTSMNTTSGISPFNESNHITQSFLLAAKAANRTRLILDLQGNGGGNTLNLAALYFNPLPRKQLHPDAKMVNNAAASNSSFTLPWRYGRYRTLASAPFPNASSFLGPVLVGPNNITQTKPALLPNAAYIDPTLLNHSVPWTQPLFPPENIVILTDGECASSCAFLATWLRHAHNIRTVVLGGRPRLGAMQGVGMTKGGTVENFGGFPTRVITDVPGPLRLSARGAAYGEGISVNLMNMVPLGEREDATPLQFRYEAANCRVFFTWEMARSAEEVLAEGEGGGVG
ncbi:hypothetical protein QBC34DRAFT_474028 [Podospora aff. communis PSN243]|uniref:Tail specific protease domain-containing protein n=1 Tax=Podospora aff. communis PSN243 TaxID=3040156 RepID=A0AAV9G9L0_9PEZI|nr:hypothetical protein QBC34DRAFT_474028 [Podospora aff. communis PSN243]